MKFRIFTIKTALAITIFLLGSVSSQSKPKAKGMAISPTVRIGYCLGGTSPIGMPATIRTLHSYTLQPNFTIGVDGNIPFSQHWGMMGGIHVEKKGMKTDAGVKGYHMKLVRGNEELEGVFTGSVVTKTNQTLISIPIVATYAANKNIVLKLGPYISYAISNKFEGYAYDGYLRRQEDGHAQGDPTGQKIELGHQEGERGEYDFSDDMRKWQVGIDIGADWYVSKNVGAYIDLTWGLIPVFKKDFTVIEQKMYPIYGSIGITYRIK